MKTSLIAALLLIANLANAAIQIKCDVVEDADEHGYSSSTVEISLPEKNVTGVADVGIYRDQKVTVSIGSGANGLPFVVGICAQHLRCEYNDDGSIQNCFADDNFKVCGQENSGLVIQDITVKVTITCTAK